ncbi:hypothetical protein TanjilG_22268 [Lupinus angustifolius]|uniref:DYW domain-containing protein n=1 Tax=Lupinus angustifolius TaxID=3871 RepID=A0A1J7HEH4_LUPAN|nr:hypothetical protein TanjilG_22268 [Lupinus angustifolius]
MSNLELGQRLHAFIVRSGYREDVSVLNGLVDFYGKCRDIISSEMVFNRIRRENVVSWCSMLSALVQNHKGERACMIFLQARKEEVEPTDFMVSSTLSACAKLGGLELGKSVHALAVKVCVEDNIFVGSALVDLYGKCGSIENTEQVFSEMPRRKLVTGKVAIFKATLLDSWIVEKNRVHVFQANDCSHERNSEIQAMLSKLRREMKEAEYVPHTNLSMFDLEEEERASEVWYHSEKIALAFGLIALPYGVPIRITKNLRICADCHSAIKFISRIVGREIVVRDKNRFHNFEDGLCYCKDYW